MESNLWSSLITLFFTNAMTGGFIHFLTVREVRRKERATADQMENIASQELQKVRTQELSNTESVVKLYKQALADIKSITESEKLLMSRTISEQNERIQSLTQSQEFNRNLINDLQLKISELGNELQAMKCQFSKVKNPCPFTGDCTRFQEYINNKK